MKFGSILPNTTEAKFIYLFFGGKQNETECLFLQRTGLKKGDKAPAAEIEKVYDINFFFLKPNIKNSAKVKTEMKYFSLAGTKDKYIGKAGTNDRNQYG